jgi:hypothetical protein
MSEGVLPDFLREIEKGQHDPALLDHLANDASSLPGLHCDLLGLPHSATCAAAVRALRARAG